MTQDEIIKTASNLGLSCTYDASRDSYSGWRGKVLEFASLVAAKEREACALLAQKTVCDTHIPTGVKIYGTAAAKAIRARGED
jgi:hypothetical protein